MPHQSEQSGPMETFPTKSAPSVHFGEEYMSSFAEFDGLTVEEIAESLLKEMGGWPIIKGGANPNLMDAPLPEAAQFTPPLRVQSFHPRAPVRQRRYPHVLREFDPFAPPERTPMERRQRGRENQEAIRDFFFFFFFFFFYETVRFDGEEIAGRRFIRWRMTENVNRNNSPILMNLLRRNVQTSLYLRHVYSYQLRNIENNDVILQYTNQGSPWFNTMSQAKIG